MKRKKRDSVIAIAAAATLVIIAGSASSQYLMSDPPSTPTQEPSASAAPLPNPEVQKWPRGSTKPLAKNADFSNMKNLAISLSYPLFDGGFQTHPAAFTGGGENDRVYVAAPYQEAKIRARAKAIANGNPYPPSDTRNFADCGAFVSTLVINFLDPDFPGLLVQRQRAYVENPLNGWKKISRNGQFNRKKLQPGDIFISTPGPYSGHMYMWLGTIDDQKNIIAQASYAPEGSSSAHLPALRVNPINSGQKDPQGRSYEVWRYVKSAS